MIFKINLSLNPKHKNIIPASYQYELSSAIYRIMAASDAEYATWLHDNGFQYDSQKRFKFFCFSNLQELEYKMEEDRLHILNNRVFFYISFLPERSTMAFVEGAFTNKEFLLGDKKSRAQFYIDTIELVPAPKNITEGEFKMLSPLSLSYRGKNNQPEYISPEHSDAGKMIVANLIEKYRFFYEKEYTGSMDFEFRLLAPPKRKGIIIKAGTPGQTKVIGYLCRFYLKCDKELMNIMIATGIGERNSVGFGFVQYYSI